MCPTEDGARSQSPRINTVWRKCTVLYSSFDLQYITTVLPLHMYCTEAMFCCFFNHTASPYDGTALHYQRKADKTSKLFVSIIKFSGSNGLITLVATICISWVKQCVCRGSESCSLNGWTVSVTVLLPPSGALRN